MSEIRLEQCCVETLKTYRSSSACCGLWLCEAASPLLLSLQGRREFEVTADRHHSGCRHSSRGRLGLNNAVC